MLDVDVRTLAVFPVVANSTVLPLYPQLRTVAGSVIVLCVPII
jgi:hypothetical protein